MSSFLQSASVTLNQNSSTIFLTGNVDCSHVSSGTAIFLNGGQYLLEGVSGTAPDTNGGSTITIKTAWTGAALSGVTLTAFNTIEGLKDAIRRARELAEGLGTTLPVEQFSKFLNTTTESVTLSLGGVDVATTPYGYILPKIKNHLTAVENGTYLDGGSY